MRIRTVKPEFWSHRMHEAISETAALVAVGLLNVADDEGRFLANARSLESTIFPLRAPRVKMPKCLDELEAVGFIKRYTATMDGRETVLGVILSFRRHQVISKPYKSRLAPPPFHDHSGNDTGMTPERSENTPEPFPADSMPIPVKEGKGREKVGSGEGKEPEKTPLPPASKNLPTTETAKRLSSLFGRRHTTAWSDGEVKAFKRIAVIDPADLDLIEAYYAAERAKGDRGIHRRDLSTFLNNWAGELDRARAPRPDAKTAGQYPENISLPTL